MALFFRDDGTYDESRRMRGFGRYRQLLGTYALRWTVVNLLTVLGALPLIFGIWLSIASSSIAVLIPASLLGGAIFGPFLAGLFDSILRGLRDAPGSWWSHYKKSWRQNWKGSLLPGALLGFLVGMASFMLYLLWLRGLHASAGTWLLYLLSILLLLLVNNLYWPQLVLFEQRADIRLKNALLFTLKHFKRTFLAALLELGYILLYLLFAPWTLILIPFAGLWFILFVAEFLLYDDLNADFQIEAQFRPLEGDPWAEDPTES